MQSIGFYSNYLKFIPTVYIALGQISDMQFNMLILKNYITVTKIKIILFSKF